MKAFLIKSNNDKLYLSNSPFYKWTNDFCEARIEKDRDGMNQILDKVLDILCDGKVVDITIEEGDLEQQLAIYKRALELACVNVNCMDCCHFNCRKEPYNEKHNCIECSELGLAQKHLSKYYLDQAKKELEECKDGLEN